MISLVPVKKDIVLYVEDVRVVRGMRRGLSDHHVLCKVRLGNAWIKRREVVNEACRVRGEKCKSLVSGSGGGKEPNECMVE